LTASLKAEYIESVYETTYGALFLGVPYSDDEDVLEFTLSDITTTMLPNASLELRKSIVKQATKIHDLLGYFVEMETKIEVISFWAKRAHYEVLTITHC
jgi:hypothetical protein